MNKELLRIIDANLNRAREGLRVCEEIARFIWKDRRLTKSFKKLRHKIWQNIKRFPNISETVLKSRAVVTDIGKSLFNKNLRKNYQDVFFANIQRTKESLRVLEEFFSIFNRSLSNSFAKLRFQVYEIEKKVSQKRKKNKL